jgi:acid phosphatase type 7
MKSRRVRAVVVVGGCLLALSACGGSTAEAPSPIPTPTPTSSFPVIVAAGDISCGSATPPVPCKSKETSDLAIQTRAVHSQVVLLPLGDLQYETGTLAEFNSRYHTTWGRLNDIARPVPGNHEYFTPGAAGYFDYFAQRGVNVGARTQGFYAHSIGDWQFLALNTNCSAIGGCDENSPQYRWLQSELLLNRRKCAVAYMHHAYLSSGRNGGTPELRPFMRLLHSNNVEIVLAGHDHTYERFSPITPEGVPDAARGLRFFVVGTGGRDLYNFASLQPNSEIRYNQDFGVLRIVTKEGGYDWAFVNIAGVTVDAGSGVCF